MKNLYEYINLDNLHKVMLKKVFDQSLNLNSVIKIPENMIKDIKKFHKNYSKFIIRSYSDFQNYGEKLLPTDFIIEMVTRGIVRMYFQWDFISGKFKNYGNSHIFK